MKMARAVLTGVAVCVAVLFPVHGQTAGPPDQPVGAGNLQASGSNVFWLQLTGLSSNAASLVIYVPGTGTVTNSVMNLFFTTNVGTTSPWTRVMRLMPGQTNPVVTDLPSQQGFFMLSSPIRPGFDQQFLPANDDGSTGSVPLPFTINFLSNSESALYVNNNGNVTFDKPLSAYTPGNLAAAGVKIIAPFWADVDTRNPTSNVVQYGTNVVQGYNAFGVDWVNVGYYNSHADALLSCQLVIIDREDIAPGDFDMEFNYDRVEWQWGDVSAGYPPRAGFSDGMIDYEMSGSGTNGAFADTNTATGLVYNSMKTLVLGRYVFLFRNGQLMP